MRPVHGVHHSSGGEMPRVPSEDVQVDRRTEGERQTTGTVLLSALGNDVTGIFLEEKWRFDGRISALGNEVTEQQWRLNGIWWVLTEIDGI